MKETLALVGNGAVKNGWKPLKRALHSLNSSYSDLPADSVLPILNFQFNVLFSDFLQSKLPLNKNFITTINNYDALMRSISSEFVSAVSSGEVTLRKNLLIKHLKDTSVDIITTNWENTLSIELNKPIEHIHGSVGHSLYLPTSTTSDFSFAYDKSGRILPQYQKVLNTLPPKEKAILTTAINMGNTALISRLNFIDKILKNIYGNLVVWGLGLNSYDNELLAIFYSFIRNCSSIKNVIVINPDKSVFRKVQGLIGGQKQISYRWVNPENKKSLKNANAFIYKNF